MSIIPHVIDENSFFNRSNHDAALTSLPQGRSSVVFPFHLNALLTGREIPASIKNLTATRLDELGSPLYWPQGDLDQEVWLQVAPGQQLVEQTGYRQKILSKALLHVATNHPETASLLRTFVRLVCWMELAPGKPLDWALGSGTFPVLPYVVFISDKALSALPPHTNVGQDSYRFLAENIAHEATHNMVNMHIAEKNIFAPHYNAQTSPKVVAVWHKEPHPEWPVDRALHATFVYNEVLSMRLRELADETCAPFEREGIRNAATSGFGALRHLAATLPLHRDQFTEEGVDLLEMLIGRSHELISAWEHSGLQQADG